MEATLIPQTSQFLAAFCATIFAGSAIYTNIAEHPARMPGYTHAATAQWAHSYRRTTFMQAPLASISLIAGIAAWLFGAGAWWLIAAVLVGAVVPFTFIAIMPTNYELLASDRDLASGATGRLLERWARLHAVRSALSLVASELFLGNLQRPNTYCSRPTVKVFNGSSLAVEP